MNILIIANYAILPGEKGNCRFHYLANLFAEQGHSVILLTSSFAHRTKTQRNEIDVNKLIKGKFNIKLIYEPGYESHLGLRRILSHNQFGINLKKALKNYVQFPDAIYFSFPTFSSASIASKFAKKNHIPSVIDIIDIWPEALRSVIKLPSFLFNFLVLPFTLRANSIYKAAGAIVGVSKTYVDRAHVVNNKVPILPVFLGADLEIFDSYKFTSIKKDGEIWLIYIGCLSYSYDIATVLRALVILNNEHKISQLKVKILGSGPQREELERIAIRNKLPVEFVGFVEYPVMVNYLKNSDIALSAIVKGAQQSITYKIGDYVSAGLPILNSSENDEFKNIIDSQKLGFNYLAGKEKDLSNKILKLISHRKKMKLYGENSRRIAERHFNRKSTNMKIVGLVEQLVEEKV
ncbi:glycosyltransferase family 4 protein [Aurantibacter crassamenti]|uniref:glycosyltransferase family 4 protein n=1 Tax=Aurantibacter crassamenti TaxID=1837375 RepID=UPI00193940E8|nr:glycosyltransferase family 4 protein [Aurantibacter crassamenti]MBM1106771.1 glycosyltransferase family 4 protein [Aurantibacter crassamenti]